MSLITAARKVVELVVEDADVSDELAEAADHLASAADAFEASLVEARSALDSIADAAAAVRETLDDQEPVPEGRIEDPSASDDDDEANPDAPATPQEDGWPADGQMDAGMETGS